MKAVKQFGICTEKLWPYNIKKFKIKPTDQCYADGLTRTITSYQSLESIDDVLHAINDNKPVVIGITVYDNFNYVSKNNPIIESPPSQEYGGGHAMTIVGYNIDKQQFLVKNSFGKGWGDRGYAWLPFKYVEDEGFEKWVFDISEQPTLLD
jgi:C1A family cysteine protease